MRSFLVVLIASLAMVSCTDAEAGREKTYQPLPADNSESELASEGLTGQLRRVNAAAGNFVIILDNGLEQTFKFNDLTTVAGNTSIKNTLLNNRVQSLVGQEGAEVTVKWSQNKDERLATTVVVGDARPELNKIAK